MLMDASLIPCGVELRAEVLVVGAGPAGITIAQELARAGILVTVVEAGGRHHTRSDDDALRGANVGTPFPLVTSRRRGFGGTSGHWTAETGFRMRPLDAIDLEPSPSRPGSSWPISSTELHAAYGRAHALLGVPDDYEREIAPADPSCPLVCTGGPELAMFRFAPHDHFTRRFDELCSHRNVDVVLHATVRALTLSPDGATIERVEVVSSDGNLVTFRPTLVVLAAGGIENARVLLSSPGRSGAGVGNAHDMVGRGLMDHLSSDCAVLETAPCGADPIAHCARVTSAMGESSDAMLWLGQERIRREGLLNAAFWLYETDATYFSRGVAGARRLVDAARERRRHGAVDAVRDMSTGAADLARFGLATVSSSYTRRRGRVVGVRIIAEQAPDLESRVRLSRAVDRLGHRRVEVDWRINAADIASMHRHCVLMSQLLEERGVGTLRLLLDPTASSTPIAPSYHPMGCTRIDPDPRRGVVDSDLRVHEVANLFIGGSSVFPAGGYLNPTLTIVALAARLAERIRSELQRPRR